MSGQDLSSTIDRAWEDRAKISPATKGAVRKAVERALDGLDQGRFRVAEKIGGKWHTHQWLKKAVLLSFRLNDAEIIGDGPGGTNWFDKVPLKCAGWNKARFRKAGFRAVPGCIVRRGAYVAPRAVLMPCFVNIGAYVGESTMIDIWATVGGCAQIGANCHISASAVIGGVIEPLGAMPTVIEDNCFIGACSGIAEGVVVEEGSIVSMGVFIGGSTRIVDRASGRIFSGRVPAGSVVVPGTLPGKPLANGSLGPSLACAVIVKRVDRKTREKTSVNELLRD